MSELRSIIREMLRQELANIDVGSVRKNTHEEKVSITNNNELADFVTRVLKLSENTKLKNQLLGGEFVFKLDNVSASSQPDSRGSGHKHASETNTLKINKGLITEKQVKNFPDDLAVVTIGKTVCLTPLASDEIRRRRIKIERSTS